VYLRNLTWRSFTVPQHALALLALAACHAATPRPAARDAVVLVSANAEWRALEQVVHADTHGTTPFDVVLAQRTVIYDIVERMGDPKEAIDAYATTIDLSWLTPQPGAIRGTIISGDLDLDPARLADLRDSYHAVAADWESGAIAHVAALDHTRVLILRGVTDVVTPAGDETYGNEIAFDVASKRVMGELVRVLPAWLSGAR
jgi:nucleoside phosphorylase